MVIQLVVGVVVPFILPHGHSLHGFTARRDAQDAASQRQRFFGGRRRHARVPAGSGHIGDAAQLRQPAAAFRFRSQVDRGQCGDFALFAIDAADADDARGHPHGRRHGLAVKTDAFDHLIAAGSRIDDPDIAGAVHQHAHGAVQALGDHFTFGACCAAFLRQGRCGQGDQDQGGDQTQPQPLPGAITHRVSSYG